MPSDPFTGAGVTALGLAAARSVETNRPDRLIDDPLARTLFDAAGADLPMRLAWPDDEAAVTDTEALHLHGSRYIGLRTRVYDDQLRSATAAGIRQAVLLGAGLDTRAHRLDLPADLAIYEIDAQAVLAFKADVLAAGEAGSRCAVVHVGADLATDWAGPLRDAGFRPDLPTAWIAEGVMPYLDERAQQELIAVIAAQSAPGSSLAFDQVTGGDVRGLSERSGIDMEGLLTGAGGIQGLVRDLAGRGWAVQTEGVEELAERYGRDLADPLGRSGAEPPWLATAFVRAGLSQPGG